MSETTTANYDQLLARRVQLQDEQTALRQQLTQWRARLTELAEIRHQALKRFDVGHDSAQIEADTALGDILATEGNIAKAERALTEFPDRMHNLNLEIERASFRDRCKQLLSLQQAERESWHEFTMLLPGFFEMWAAFNQARTERRAMARSLTNYAGNQGLSMPDSGDFPTPTEADLIAWLSGKPVVVAGAIESAIAKAQRGMGV